MFKKSTFGFYKLQHSPTLTKLTSNALQLLVLQNKDARGSPLLLFLLPRLLLLLLILLIFLLRTANAPAALAAAAATPATAARRP